VEARLRPVNALLGLMTPGDLAPPVLADAGFRVAGLEIPVGLESDRLVTDVLLVHDLTGHLLACKAEVGGERRRGSGPEVRSLDAHQVATGSVDLPRRTAGPVATVPVAFRASFREIVDGCVDRTSPGMVPERK